MIGLMVMQNGAMRGYIRSVSYMKSSFAVTQNKNNAKKYKTLDEALRDIDILTRISNQRGTNYLFCYEYLG